MEEAGKARALKLKKIVFWIGVIVLVVGVVLFGYALQTIQSLRSRFPINFYYRIEYYPDLKQQWDLAQILQWVGLGLLALGAILIIAVLLPLELSPDGNTTATFTRHPSSLGRIYSN